MSEPAPPSFRPPTATVPPAFVIGVAIMLVAGVVIQVLVTYGVVQSAHRGDRGWIFDFLQHGRGLAIVSTSFATSVLMLVGFNELVRRAGPGLDGNFLRAGAVAMGAMLILWLAGAYTSFWYMPRGELTRDRLDTLDTFWTWRQRFACALAMVASLSLILAGRRLRVLRLVALPLLVLTALMWPTPWVDELISIAHPSSSGDHWTQASIDVLIRIGFCGALMAGVSAIGTSLPPAPTDLPAAGRGLERAGSAIVAAVCALVVSIFVLVMTYGAQSPGLARVTSIVFPMIALVTSVALVTGVLQAAALSRDDAPRKRLYAAAALIAITLVIGAVKAVSLYIALRRGGDVAGAYDREQVRGLVEALPYATAALGLAGFVCLLSALAAIRPMVPEARIEEASIWGAMTTLIVLTIAAFALLRWAQTGGARDAGTFVLVSIVSIGASIVAQLAVARACHRVGEAMRETSTLPTAVATLR